MSDGDLVVEGCQGDAERRRRIALDEDHVRDEALVLGMALQRFGGEEQLAGKLVQRLTHAQDRHVLVGLDPEILPENIAGHRMLSGDDDARRTLRTVPSSAAVTGAILMASGRVPTTHTTSFAFGFRRKSRGVPSDTPPLKISGNVRHSIWGTNSFWGP